MFVISLNDIYEYFFMVLVICKFSKLVEMFKLGIEFIFVLFGVVIYLISGDIFVLFLVGKVLMIIN